MAKERAKKQRIPDEAKCRIHVALDRLKDPRLQAETCGRFCYITCEGSPLCRLGYTAGDSLWDFAIYKYSSSSYGKLDFARSRGSAVDCIEIALSAYDL